MMLFHVIMSWFILNELVIIWLIERGSNGN